MTKLLVLDMDDTLYLEASYSLSGFAAAANVLPTRELVLGFTEAAASLFGRGVRGTIFNSALKQIGLKDDPDLVTSMLMRFRDHRPAISLCSDALDLLRTISIPTGLISDGYLPSQARKVEALELSPMIDKIILTESLGRKFWKPHPKAFRLMEEHFNIHGADCMYVGDNPTKDFDGPKQLGWQTVRIRRPSAMHERVLDKPGMAADRTIRSLSELSLEP